MENENSIIKVVDKQTGHIFYQASLDQADKAFIYAAELEEMGLDIDIIRPTLTESLLNSLGATSEESEIYKLSLEEEIESHDSSSCSKCQA